MAGARAGGAQVIALIHVYKYSVYITLFDPMSIHSAYVCVRTSVLRYAALPAGCLLANEGHSTREVISLS